jgi:hypothetical protein
MTMAERILVADDKERAGAGIDNLAAHHPLDRLACRPRRLPRLDTPDDAAEVVEALHSSVRR